MTGGPTRNLYGRVKVESRKRDRRGRRSLREGALQTLREGRDEPNVSKFI